MGEVNLRIKFVLKRTYKYIPFLMGFLSFFSWQKDSFASYGYRPNEIIIKYRDGVTRNKSMMDSFYSHAAVKEVKRLRGVLKGMEKLVLEDHQDVNLSVAELKLNPLVEYAQPNYILKTLPIKYKSKTRAVSEDGDSYGIKIPCFMPGTNFPAGCEDWDIPMSGSDGRPNIGARPKEVIPSIADPDLHRAYGLEKSGAIDAWKTHKGDSRFVVAVIDTGIDYNHEDLAFNVWRNSNPSSKNDVVGYDFFHDDGLPYDDNMHGTHCAGVIGAVGGNGVAISGMNQRVSIMALKFLDNEGSGDTAAAIQAISYAVSHGAKVLSNSWGGGGASENMGLEDAVKKAEQAGVLVVAAAGNEGSNDDVVPTFPASFRESNMITVAATDETDTMARFSNYGKETVHLAAPGVDIYSTTPHNSYRKLSGTSMACPHVAGAVALLWSRHPEWNYRDVKEMLLSSVDKVDDLVGRVQSGGRLNVARAIQFFL